MDSPVGCFKDTLASISGNANGGRVFWIEVEGWRDETPGLFPRFVIQPIYSKV
jgi:hypothetical protein